MPLKAIVIVGGMLAGVVAYAALSALSAWAEGAGLECRQSSVTHVNGLPSAHDDFPLTLGCDLRGVSIPSKSGREGLFYPWKLFFAEDTTNGPFAVEYYCLWAANGDGEAEMHCAMPAAFPRDWEELENRSGKGFYGPVIYLDIPGLDQTLAWQCWILRSALLESVATYSCELHPDQENYSSPVSERFRAWRLKR